MKSEIKLEKDEQIEDLLFKGLKIIQNKKLYTFTSDAVILANFCKIKKGEVACEIGSGCGVISILLSLKMNPKKIYAFELQESLYNLAKKNVILNNLQDKIEVIHNDVENFNCYFKNECFDVVFSNPPYMVEDDCVEESVRSNARHDKTLKIEKLCENSSKLLKFGGRLYLVYSSSRCCELIYNLIKFNLQPKKMFFTENGKGKTVLVVIEAVKGGKYGTKVLPSLVTNDENGEYLEQLHTKYC